ncbi:MAG TPA: purine-nucleoside phosphorylase [Candidatus Eremiobacteraeota bacterium]|nr:MAG: Purine nucleoside phosphorylase 1 [bacterium ADurb.Bin363]HPZ09784.1 purine-nucleoside phosphorylase [Candidatus Eremiobacteraeota bacterium]
MKELKEKITQAVDSIKIKTDLVPQIGLILGSGLGVLADEIVNKVSIKYSEIKGFPLSTVEGHVGAFVMGELEGKIVIAQQGRLHYYEGYPMKDITLPLRVMKALGIKVLIVTNAAGGINPEFKAGDLMIITDHINLMGHNPLIGVNDSTLGPRFPDISQIYDRGLRELAIKTAEKIGLSVRQGIYVAVSGPSYETKAELKFMHMIGGDSVGMSTAPEVIVAGHSSIPCLGISCITNCIDFISNKKLTHEEVIEVGNATVPKFSRLVKEIIKEMKI